MNRLIRTAFISLCLLYLPTATAAPEEIDRLVGVVNNEAISLTELQTEMDGVKKQLLSQQRSLPSEEVLASQVLERLILKHLQQQLAASNNIIIDDETLNRTIKAIADQNKLSLGAFRQRLLEDGYNFDQFREDIRYEVLATRLRQRFVDNRISISEAEVDQFLAQQKKSANSKDEYRLSHILISTPDGASADQIRAARQKATEILQQIKAGADFAKQAISHSDGQNALDGGDLGWRRAGQLPTLFANLVTNMKNGDTSDLIRSPSGFHIIRLMEHRSGSRHVVTQTHARHILIKTNELIDDEGAKNKLKQLKQRILQGDDFNELAKAHSHDKGSASKGGDLGWSNPGQMVPQFEEVMDKLEPGKISDPFQTSFGWHIVQVLDRRKRDDTDDFQRNNARKQLLERKIAEEQELWLRRLRDEAYVEIHI